MPPLINSIVLGCLVAYGLVALVDLARFRLFNRFAVELGLLIAAAVILRATEGFPEPEAGQAFGANGTGSLPMVGLMFLCITVGMLARYLFYVRGPLVWMPFFKPLCVSPIVLLPLMGTLQAGTALEPIQVISFCLLAFQNGFFWRVVFERAQSSLAT